MNQRRLATALVLVAATTVMAHAARWRSAPRRVVLERVPFRLGGWLGRDIGPLDRDTLNILQADAYLNRSYEDAGPPIGLYVAYYARQRPGVSIHSPLHCLPGTGWEALDDATIGIARGDGSSGSLRRLLVRKGRDRAVVLYWYAVHGRMIGSEILSKAWLLHDSVLYNRSDAALVRVVVPVTTSVDAAQRLGIAFVQSLLPRTSSWWS